jgi:hypothetical protein
MSRCHVYTFSATPSPPAMPLPTSKRSPKNQWKSQSNRKAYVQASYILYVRRNLTRKKTIFYDKDKNMLMKLKIARCKENDNDHLTSNEGHVMAVFGVQRKYTHLELFLHI